DLHGRGCSERCAADDVQVPAREILGTGRDFRYECFCLFFRHEAALSVDRLRMTRTAQSIYCSDSMPLSSEFRHEDTTTRRRTPRRHRDTEQSGRGRVPIVVEIAVFPVIMWGSLGCRVPMLRND